MDTINQDDIQKPLLEGTDPPEVEPTKNQNTTGSASIGVEIPCCEAELERFLHEIPLPNGIRNPEEFQEVVESPFLWWGYGADPKNALTMTTIAAAICFAFASLMILLTSDLDKMNWRFLYAFVTILIVSTGYGVFAIIQRTSQKVKRQQEETSTTTHRSSKSRRYLFGHTLVEVLLYLAAIQCCFLYDQISSEWVLHGLQWCRQTAIHATGPSGVVAGLIQVWFVAMRVLVHYSRAVFGIVVYIHFFLPIQTISYKMNRHLEIPSLRDFVCLLLHIPPCLMGLQSATLKLLQVAGDELGVSMLGFLFIMVGARFIPPVALRLCPKAEPEVFRLTVRALQQKELGKEIAVTPENKDAEA